MALLSDWLDHRTGYRKFKSAMLLEDIPGGAKWRYVWGSTLVFVFALQLITGVLLMTAYSPSDTTAWASVHYIQYQMDFGWLIRGLHHFGSQTMMVLIALHMLQVVIAGAHLPPREVNWWLGMGLLGITFGLSLTGYLLPWDQKGYFATRVATNIASTMPGGDFIRQVIIGGPDYGNHTLTRFYALHVAILPLSLIGLLVLHIAVFRRHGVTAPANAQGGEFFWPGQAFRDLIVCLLVFGFMLGLVVFGGHGNPVEVPRAEGEEPTLYEQVALAGREGRGANLDAPADRDTQNYPARPEWYFLFLFQLLKYFEGDQVIVGTVLIPNAVVILLLILPLLGYGRMRRFGHVFGIVVMVTLIGAAGVLTLLALADDHPEPIVFGLVGNRDDGTDESRHRIAKAKEFQHSVHDAEVKAKRAAQLAMVGVPDDGARQLLRSDPLTRGHDLFKTNCAVCHKFTAQPGDPFEGFTKGTFKAADLGDYASAAWIRGLLANPGHDTYFGLTSLGGMKRWRRGVDRDRKDMEPKEIAAQDADFDLIAKFLADQAHRPEKRDKELAAKGLEAFKRQECSSCHTFGNEIGDGSAPELTDYGSQEWIRLMVMNPAHKSRFGDRNEMPAFRNKEGPGSEVVLREFLDGNPEFSPSKILHLSDADRELIIRFMTRDDRVVFGGKTISGPPRK